MARVLVVDDEPEVRLLHRILLEKGGHDVAEAVDGSEALDHALENDVDVVITDLMMPVMDGRQLIAKLEKAAAHCKPAGRNCQRHVGLLRRSRC